MIANLRKRVKRIINDKRIELFMFEGTDKLISGTFHIESAVGQHRAKNLDELEDFLFAVIRKDIRNIEQQFADTWKHYYFGLRDFNVENGVVTYGRGSILF